MSLNSGQLRVSNAIKKFLSDPASPCFMIMGAGGTGKTYLTSKALAEVSDVTFASFTNKAVLMLINTLKKLGFEGSCMTLHGLLGLKPRTADHSNRKMEIQKQQEANPIKVFDFKNLSYLINSTAADVGNSTDDDLLMFDYDYREVDEFPSVVVVDEFSMIPPELYMYLISTQRHQAILGNQVKYIFLGDPLQLPPIGHKTSVVMDEFKRNGWPRYKLPLEIMRSAAPGLAETNVSLISYIRGDMSPGRRLRDVLSKSAVVFVRSQSQLIDKFVDKHGDGTSVLVSSSNRCCMEMSQKVQDLLDKLRVDKLKRIPDDFYSDQTEVRWVKPMVWFLPGDLMCVSRMIQVFKEDDSSVFVSMFPGEQFEILGVQVKTIRLPFGDICDAQILRVRVLGDDSAPVLIIRNPDNLQALKARLRCKRRNYKRYNVYAEALKKFQGSFCVLVRGYAITCYKAQGSEYDRVFVNAQNIWGCVYRGNSRNYIMCMRNLYTAISRAKKEVVVFE